MEITPFPMDFCEIPSTTMTRQVCLITVFLLLMSMWSSLAQNNTGNTSTLTETQTQLVYVLQQLMKNDHSLATQLGLLVMAANNTQEIPAAQAHVNPLLNLLLKSLGDMLKNPTPPVTTNNINGSQPPPMGQSQAPPSGQNNLLDTLTQSAVLRELMALVTKQIIEGQQQAKQGNISVDSPLMFIHPLPLVQQLLASMPARTAVPLKPSGLVSDVCYNDVMTTFDSLVAMKKWAVDMIDATGKPNAGLQRGSFYFLGSYDQCYQIKPEIKAGDVIGGVNVTSSRSFSTKFCRANIPIPDSFVESLHVDTHGIRLKLIMGLCVPETCHSADMEGLFKLDAIKRLNIPVESVHCYDEKDLSADKSAIAAICVLSVFGFLVVCGTFVDVIRRHQSGDRNPEMAAVAAKYTPNRETNEYANITKNGQDNVNKENASNDKIYVNGFPPDFMPHKESYKGLSTIPNGDMMSTEKHINGDTINPRVQNGGVSKSENRQSKPRQGILERAVVCFSLYSNVPKILHAASGAGAVNCIHGIRFLSLTWVMIGHTFNYGIISQDETFTADNLLDFVPYYQRFTYQAVIGGGFAVDTFFVLSGFLVTWLQLKEMHKRNKCALGDWIMYYFHRFWRLTPIYMMVLMTFGCLYQYMGSGPFWPSKLWSAEHCKTVWWTNLLYVNNLVSTDAQCMGHTWYLADDMQYYVITPIFLALMYIKPLLGALSTLLLLCVGIGITYWKEHDVSGNFFSMKSDGGRYWKEVYTVPWCRVGCWAIGMLLGLLICKRGNKPIKNRALVLTGWMAAAGAALAIIYSPYGENKDGGEVWTPTQRAFYEGFGRPAWGLCIAWVIFACHTGCGGIINSLLSWNGLIPLSRLTYAAYLVHPIVMEVYFSSRRTLFHVNDYSIIYLFLGHFGMTYMVSFVVSLMFEAPAMGLEKVLFRPSRKS
ncbi:O-acyltransferase like protein-like isoform X1 [Dreissena polymorpha]|uniref:O-acyltransferase like protein-like isoform X1 n=1 Tax=Dreissena polymorpha TaxID=45954 RepID=UPI002263EA38|nr:O-acyltransferase like protein-like isoform X1 [Dreissena polymorpha]